MRKFMKQFVRTLLLGLCLISCNEVYDDFSNDNLPTSVATGDVVYVKQNSAKINFGSNGYVRHLASRKEHSGYGVFSTLIVSQSSNPMENDENIKISVDDNNATWSPDGAWEITGLESGITYYYREIFEDYLFQEKMGDVKSFTTLEAIRLEAELKGSDKNYLYFTIRVYNYQGTPYGIGLFFNGNSNVSVSNYGQRYYFNNTPSNEAGVSPWVMNMTIAKSGFSYQYSSFWFMPYIRETSSSSSYITGTAKYCNP